ncbi:MAG: TIGR04222 domain-containing membrane protein [Limisphaerales bacterium]
MKPEHLELAHRLGAYQLDDPAAALTFSERLARDNGWTARFAERAIQEYKRFAFLSVAAGHPVSPPDAVDQVWHEHLIYTESYWKDFCGDVLGKPLHHHPTRGGADESEKFAKWYAQTLASYRNFFGEEPPADIWPSAATRKTGEEQHCAVNPLRNWVVPKPRLATCIAVVFAGGAALWVSPQIHSPFELFGPEFLWFYLGCILVGLVAGALVRRRLRNVDGEAPSAAKELDPYAVAHLVGGEAAAVNAALTSLVQRDIVSVTGDEARVRVLSPLPADAHPLESAIHTLAPAEDGVGVVQLREKLALQLKRIGTGLEARGWLLAESQARRAMLVPFSIAAVVLALGAAKSVVGLWRHRPIAMLVTMAVIAAILFAVSFLRRPRRSLAGDHAVAKLKEEHRALEHLTPSLLAAEPSLGALAVGLFGVGVLANTALASLEKPLTPQAGNASGGCSGGGGGCGGGGCGGGCGGCGG